jgi:phenylacetate-CoA ligase
MAGAGRGLGFDFHESRLRVGLFGAEPWSEGIRERIERDTGISATDNYGLSEVLGPGVAGECELKDGMHISEDHFIAEVVDPETGKRLRDGQQGELVLTTLAREAMPVVRFRTGDLTEMWREPCGCGRRNARMRKVLGRTDDMLIIRGVNVYPSQVEKALLQVDGIEPHFLIMVDRRGELDSLEVLVEVSEGLFSDDTRRMREFTKRVETHLKSVLNVRVQVTLKEPNSIERSPGKAKRIVDRREA